MADHMDFMDSLQTKVFKNDLEYRINYFKVLKDVLIIQIV